MVNPELKKDVRWWKDFLPKFQGVLLLWLYEIEDASQVIVTDTCLTGAGLTSGKEFFHYKFPNSILQCTEYISQREILVIVIVLKLQAKKIEGKFVHVKADNKETVTVINTCRT